VNFLRSVVGKLWATIIGLVAIVLLIVGHYLIRYIDYAFANPGEIKRLFVYAGVAGFLLTTFFAFFLITRITRPLVEMKEAANRITRGDYRIRVPEVSRGDEIGQLSRAMNLMAEELERTIMDLSLERDKLANILQSLTDAVITFDADGRIDMANQQGEELLAEWSRLHWAGEPAPAKGRLPEPLMDVFREVIESRRQLTTKLHVGSGVWSVVMAPLYRDEQLKGAVAALRDITEQDLEERLRRDFLANVSHELRTPLSMLQGYSEALIDDVAATPEERRELAQVIHDESVRMGRLVNDLMDLAKMEAGRLELKRGHVDVSALLDRVVRKYAIPVRDREIRLTLDNRIGRLVLEGGDEGRLEQVLTNLLDNAFRHSAAGTEITLSAEMAEWKGKPAVRLVVADQGEGIPEHELSRIFERFYKVDKARTRASGGTGLGLAIVKQIVDLHRGTISVTSRPGAGTRFEILLPVS
jgi:two-component system sensor histidine kinase ResE